MKKNNHHNYSHRNRQLQTINENDLKKKVAEKLSLDFKKALAAL